jgi:hypothetical protein
MLQAVVLRKHAAALVKDSMEYLYHASADGHGWFNVVHPQVDNETKPATSLTVNEMRHAVDFFSVTFGFCGLSDQPCDFTPKVRQELATWFREESVTSTWIRATSPKCNCANNYTVPYSGNGGSAAVASTSTLTRARNSSGGDGGENTNTGTIDGNEISTAAWPGFATCQADRPDHGTTGAYPSWPAFSTEALCYLEGNCTAAFRIMSTFVANTCVATASIL